MSSQAQAGVTERPVFPILDTLRAVGALSVLTTHAAFWAGSYTSNGVWGTLLARLDIGVAIFFVLSGFLLARPYFARAALGRPAPTTGRYLWKRLLRIAPVYVLAVVLALTFIERNQRLGVGDWLVTLSMTNTFVSSTLPDGLTQMWSLAVEVTFYLILPLLMLAATGRRRRLHPVRVVGVLTVLVLVTVWWHVAGAASVDRHTSGAPGQWLPAYLTWFAVGIFLALAHVQHERGAWAAVTGPLVSAARQPGSSWAIVAGLMLVLATPLAGPTMLAVPTANETLTKNLCYALVGGLLVLTGIFPDPRSRYHRFMAAPASRRLGFVSYGVFCLHLPILHLVMWTTGWSLFQGRLPAIWTITLVVSLIAAELTYRLIEAPAMRLKNFGRSVAGTSTATTGTSIK